MILLTSIHLLLIDVLISVNAIKIIFISTRQTGKATGNHGDDKGYTNFYFKMMNHKRRLLLCSCVYADISVSCKVVFIVACTCRKKTNKQTPT